MNTSAAINAYNSVGLETAVMTADPHKLIALLFEGALIAIAKAKGEIQHKQTMEKGRSIAKATTIISEGLLASLDMKAGGELAERLAGLYGHMIRRLNQANVDNDITALDEVSGLLTQIKEAWDAIRPQVVATAP
jgi:flagellar secretion chaperone FliS